MKTFFEKLNALGQIKIGFIICAIGCFFLWYHLFRKAQEIRDCEALIRHGQQMPVRFSGNISETKIKVMGLPVRIHMINYHFSVDNNMYTGKYYIQKIDSFDRNKELLITYLPDKPDVHDFDPQKKLEKAKHKTTLDKVSFGLSFPAVIVGLLLVEKGIRNLFSSSKP